MFDTVREYLDKYELKHLMRKLRFPANKMQEMEETYKGNANLKDRISQCLLCWKEYNQEWANCDELVRILHIIGEDDLSTTLKEMKIKYQALRL